MVYGHPAVRLYGTNLSRLWRMFLPIYHYPCFAALLFRSLSDPGTLYPALFTYGASCAPFLDQTACSNGDFRSDCIFPEKTAAYDCSTLLHKHCQSTFSFCASETENQSSSGCPVSGEPGRNLEKQKQFFRISFHDDCHVSDLSYLLYRESDPAKRKKDLLCLSGICFPHAGLPGRLCFPISLPHLLDSVPGFDHGIGLCGNADCTVLSQKYSSGLHFVRFGQSAFFSWRFQQQPFPSLPHSKAGGTYGRIQRNL